MDETLKAQDLEPGDRIIRNGEAITIGDAVWFYDLLEVSYSVGTDIAGTFYAPPTAEYERG